MKVSLNPDVTLYGWLGSKPQLTNYPCHSLLDQRTQPLGNWMQDVQFLQWPATFMILERQLKTCKRDGKPQGPLELGPEVADPG